MVGNGKVTNLIDIKMLVKEFVGLTKWGKNWAKMQLTALRSLRSLVSF
jgi:hypothetical protein